MLVRGGSRAQQIDGALCHGRQVRATVDYSLIRSWIRKCDQTHHPTCSKHLVGLVVGPSRLIDVRSHQIIRTDSRKFVVYAALSYVWGRREQLKLDADTMQSLEKPRGLKLFEREIPPTIKDAMTVCQKVGIRYLWVDSLCIRQDLGDEKQREINAMASIYNGAIFTIVAASADDAWAPLPGVSKSTRPTHIPKIIKGLKLARAGDDYRITVEQSTWNTRGWTYQEGILSRRLLIFSPDQVFFRCNSAIWQEDTVLEFPDSMEYKVQMAEPGIEHPFWKESLGGISPASFFQSYNDMVKSYVERELTNAKDALNAFNGVLKVIEESRAMKFSVGLPEKYFYIALCFSFPEFDGVPEQVLRRPMFPTWSWVAWESEDGIYYDDALLDAAHDRRALRGLSTFYIGTSKGLRRIIRSKRGLGIRHIERNRLFEQIRRRLHSARILGVSWQHVLLFRAETAWLHISDSQEHIVTCPKTKAFLGNIVLHAGCLDKQGKIAEFVAICECEWNLRWYTWLLLIDTQSGLSTRLVTLKVPAGTWLSLSRRQRIVYLM